jgi:hypothetical protein
MSENSLDVMRYCNQITLANGSPYAIWASVSSDEPLIFA